MKRPADLFGDAAPRGAPRSSGVERRPLSTRPYFSRKQRRLVASAVDRALASGQLILGPIARELEQRFEAYCDVPHAVAVSSCTAALEITLRYAGVASREVIVPTNTFVADANAVLYAGGTPVLADVDPESLCLDVDDLRRKLTSRTRAVIVVHIAGLAHPRWDEIAALCRKRGIFLIEDVAHAVGATYRGRMAGSLGDAACFSFYPTKVMTTGTGGMITTRDRGLAEYAQSLRHHGAGPGGLTDVRELGNDWLLDEVSASLGLAQLSELEHMLARRRQIAAQYANGVRKLDAVSCLREPPHCRHVYYKFPLLVRTAELRNRLSSSLKQEFGIETGSIYYPPIHRQPCHRKRLGLRAGDYPNAEDVLGRILCLPVAVQMTAGDVRYVLGALRTALERARP